MRYIFAIIKITYGEGNRTYRNAWINRELVKNS